MRILIINFEYPPLGGGGAVATAHIAELLAQRHTVHVITSGYADLPADNVEAGVAVHRVPVWGRRDKPTASLRSLISFVPTALRRGRQLCRREQFDVLNAQFAVPSGVPAAVLAALYRVPFVLSFIGGDVYDPTKGTSPHRHASLRWLIRRLAGAAAARTAISADTARRARDLLGVREPITVTHLGIFPFTCQPTDRSQLGLPAGAFLFVTIGRLIPRKRCDLLLSVLREISGAHLVIIGTGPLAEQLKQKAAAAGVADRVYFLGYLSEGRKQQVLCAADAYISGAEHEGFGLVFLEAMQAGLPITTAGEGGQADFLTHEVNALLVPPHDAAALAAAARRLMADADLRERMGQENMRRVRNYYWTRTVRVFEQVLQEAARHGKR
ncbi:MAG: hypothetical protein COT71_01705 [Candidatus Andersenbacteria bacterium CG10_big_fil_rev_8_21_14_0_10_54_11]|uniref:Glycosyltransferase family 1 protein n=1 Tax=Candidatus Andersenbacteria bacterium CG10_big_fil_rev_8_21_14_0_10_54_11 TaxID=1974485 RepID=A0A2M6WZM7_9BACT|nr:MAG: hypothetical protein COT71_01705 [Candidatus Andersenbacteria bacterium CG10_big_fil_rev_8_21_14_0_10_54_11]